MNVIFQKTGIVAALAAAVLFSSCDDDDATPPKDETAPEITLTGVDDSTPLFNTVKITVAAADKDIDLIEIKVDGVVVGTATTAPYEFNWDTQKETEGPHTVVTIVTDKSGNKKEAEVKVTVQNVLFEAKVPANMMRTKSSSYGYDERGFLFLSDEQGKVIVAHEFKNGEAISLRAPGFAGTHFTITQAQYHPSSTGHYTSLTTTTQVNRGKWVLRWLSPYDKPAVADAVLSFTNRNVDLDYKVITSYGNSLSLDHVIANGKGLDTNPSLLFVTSEPKDGSGTVKYHVFPITSGTNANALDLALVNKTLTTETITMPQGHTGFVRLWNRHTFGGLPQLLNEMAYDSDPNGKIILQYPSEGYEGTYSFTELHGPEYDAYTYSRKPYDLTPLAATLSASRNGRKITVAATGTMDVIHADLSQSGLGWNIFAAKATTSIVIPDLPTLLTDAGVPDVNTTTVKLKIVAEDFQQTQDYKTYLDFIRASKDGYVDINIDLPEQKKLSKDIKN